jgi:hypothetical protein
MEEALLRHRVAPQHGSSEVISRSPTTLTQNPAYRATLPTTMTRTGLGAGMGDRVEVLTLSGVKQFLGPRHVWLSDDGEAYIEGLIEAASEPETSPKKTNFLFRWFFRLPGSSRLYALSQRPIYFFIREDSGRRVRELTALDSLTTLLVAASGAPELPVTGELNANLIDQILNGLCPLPPWC